MAPQLQLPKGSEEQAGTSRSLFSYNRGWSACLLGGFPEAQVKKGEDLEDVDGHEIDLEVGSDTTLHSERPAEPSSCSEPETAGAIFHMLAPVWTAKTPDVALVLEQENLIRDLDVAMLDKDDLRELGLSMAERNRVLQWSQNRSSCCESSPEASQELRHALVTETSHAALSSMNFGGGFYSPKGASRNGPSCFTSFFQEGAVRCQCSPSTKTPTRTPFSSKSVRHSHAGSFCFEPTNSFGPQLGSSNSELQRLDAIESRADFWCGCFAEAADMTPETLSGSLQDVRENILEAFFDCTPERVKEVFASMGHGKDPRLGSVDELKLGLERCGLSGLDHGTLKKVFHCVIGEGGSVNLQSFESILSRLRLAHLLRIPLKAKLEIVDYTYSKAAVKTVDETNMREFSFGHRSCPKQLEEGPTVRWVHMPSFDLTLLLALTAKYCLHPLSVEDVIEQCPTKIDRFGSNYFLAVELLTVTDAGEQRGGTAGSVPVRVHGHHVTAFCAGPPALDTLVTIAQADKNFGKDWPGGSSSHGNLPAAAWPERLQQRLLAARSRLRERRADFLLYTVVDLCTDELVSVTRAYLARLAWLEADLRTQGEKTLLDLGEISLAQLQLAVVARRLRSLQRVVRRASEYKDLHTTGSSDYWKDCADHLEEAFDDAIHLGDRCNALKASHEQVMERSQAERLASQQDQSSAQAERMNRMLFFLTVATTLFTPLQFMSSVYGMNFVDKEGTPTIPELLVKDGYRYFWTFAGSYLVVAILLACCLYRRLPYVRR
eukprot:TRINITY_DN34887_c0_g1_i1.p1 TRINITY_DN34887_c0_g1~~TRINITY_DN34887_c0_g1_i1.p1  ORF type:complete len:775 (-),score=141.18 TRINITY_DN34887_c0_g1_i1:203-2527(-)